MQVVRKLAVAQRLALVLAALAVVSPAVAQEKPAERLDVWSLQIGSNAAGLPDGFINYACGTNGGPPSRPLKNFAEFATCKPDDFGLHEVYFEYDDELEYWARALELQTEINIYGGTLAFEYPVVASALFDDSGKLQGERMVTDPRQHSAAHDRVEYWTLANFVRQRFGLENWTCNDIPPADGEGPVGSYFIKNHCEKVVDGNILLLEQRFFQKKGQVFKDEHTGKILTEAYESSTRFEIFSDAYYTAHKPTK